uniref:Phosphate transporter n=1 Tax=Steinernema glaseri TaxID=37863 RepID=A0A1I8ABK7_9BILA
MDTTLSFLATTPSLPAFQHAVLWALIVGIILAFVLGFGMGANDVANAFGTSVGSKVLSLRNAFILACIFETLGAVLVGYNVTDTMRKGVIDVAIYKDDPKALEVGQVAILGGCGAWLIIATIFKLPVSTTHSLVGATIGMSVLVKGFNGINWMQIVSIVSSWFISPLLSGTISAVIYLILDHAVLRRKDTFNCGLRALPIFYFFCIAFNAFAVSYQGSKILHLSSIPLWMAFAISIGAGSIIALLVHFVARPRLIKWVESSSDLETPTSEKTETNEKTDLSSIEVSVPSKSDESQPDTFMERLKYHLKRFFPARDRQEDEKTLKLFSSIQVFTACFAGFAHGANDVSNAIAPLTALLAIYMNMDVMQTAETPIYVLLYGVFAICVGLCILGHRVIKTVGQEMSEINPASGFTIEFGAAVTALLASKMGIPISTTHCLVGSVVMVGTIKSGKGIDWGIFRNIALSWAVTLPVSGLISAAIMFGLKFTL